MLYYHSTQLKEKILSDQKFKISKFDYAKYMDKVINAIWDSESVNGDTFKKFCKNKLPAPKQYMGNGVYVFDKEDLAKEFQTNCEVITLTINDNNELLNYSKQEEYQKLVIFLDNFFPKWINDKYNESDAKAYNYFVKIALYGLTNGFKDDDAPLFGLIMFFLYEVYLPALNKSTVKYPDIISYVFNNETYSIIKSKTDKPLKVKKDGIIEKIS